jgi:multidrug efflux system membrane fusion protein
LPIDPHEAPIKDPSRQLSSSSSSSDRPHGGGGGFVRIIVWIIVILIFAGAFYWVLHRHEAAKATPSRGAAQANVPVVPATAEKGNLGVYQDAIGTVTPVYTSTITSQVSGIITQVNYREGQLVAKGQSLIEIDARPYEANLMQAQGTLEKDQGVLAQAQMDLERYRTALANNAIARQQFEDQEKLVQQDQGVVKTDQGTVQFDQVQVQFCHITAPIAGRIGLRLVDPGNVVSSSGGTTLAVITQEQPITVIFTIPEDVLGKIAPRLKSNAKLAVDAYDREAKKKVASGTLITIDNQVDTTTGTVKARAQFNNRDGSLYPNEFVNVRLLENTLQNVTLIPTSAIQHNGNATFVYVITNNKAQMRTVKAGVVDGDTTQVTGINPGDVVANSSFDKIQPNGTVRLSAPAAAPAAASGSSAP